MLDSIQHIDLGVVPYGQALALQYRLRAQLQTTEDQQHRIGYLITLQHPLTVTIGKRGTVDALLGKPMLREHHAEVFTIDRGGEATLHNEGQLVVYPIVRLDDYNIAVVDLVRKTAYAVANAMALYNITTDYDKELPGLWGEIPPQVMQREGYVGLSRRKFASVGMRISRNTSMHGLAVNVVNDLTPFSWIAACGMEHPPMARVADLTTVDFATFKDQVVQCWCEQFGVTRTFAEVELPEHSDWEQPIDW